MEEVMEEGPWFFQGQPVVLQAWEQGMTLRRHKHMQVPVWIRLRHLPLEYWTEDGLSAVASGVGIPLYTDRITKSCSRLDYARVCIMLDYQSKLPRHLVIISPSRGDGKEVPIKIDIEYEWLPMRCTQCCSLGHNLKSCPELKVRKQSVPVSIFVQKQPNPVDLSSKGGDKSELEADGAAEVEAGGSNTADTVKEVSLAPTNISSSSPSSRRNEGEISLFQGQGSDCL
ncbi:UNVERIFIED_CONTAM: hypothetical protein Sradi_7013700 [Sesamum radiatum]|uniref:DUF4283 domain-containing protein n=1 Tax=Sesamum radiatum TaxID=300843 RepID=A0AAW2JB11_SESRA